MKETTGKKPQKGEEEKNQKLMSKISENKEEKIQTQSKLARKDPEKKEPNEKKDQEDPKQGNQSNAEKENKEEEGKPAPAKDSLFNKTFGLFYSLIVSKLPMLTPAIWASLKYYTFSSFYGCANFFGALFLL